MLDGITSCFNKAKVKNPFLSPSLIELALSSFVRPIKEVNNQVLFVAELKDIVENQPVNEKARKQSQAEYKYHPKSNQELKDLVAYNAVKLSEIDISKVSNFTQLFITDYASLYVAKVIKITHDDCAMLVPLYYKKSFKSG